jgi:hypothetical protein
MKLFKSSLSQAFLRTQKPAFTNWCISKLVMPVRTGPEPNHTINMAIDQETDQGTLAAGVRVILRTRELGSISTRLILSCSNTLAIQLAGVRAA